ncbi:allantoicase-like protein [Aureococcus anophagefferens]|nr:allantoicase-like protein [Aureococcus anophagefferens]
MGRAMRGLGYAALGVGNHDLEFAAELGNLSAAARAPFVSASACRTYDHVRCTRLRRAGDVRVGFLGYTDTATLPGGRACDDATAAAALDDARDLRFRGADVVIALGHCGYDFDLRLFARARERASRIDAILGGHTHLVRGVAGRRAPVVAQAGVSGSHLGVLVLALGRRAGGVRVDAARVTLVPLEPDRRRDDPAFADFAALVDAELGEPSTESWRDARGAADALPCRSGECALGSLVADAMERLGCETTKGPVIALLESGSVRGRLEAGPVGRDAATRVLPWANRYAVLTFENASRLDAFAAHGAASRAPRGTGGAFLQASSRARVVVDGRSASVLVADRGCEAARNNDGPLVLDDDALTVPPGCFRRPAGPVDVVVTEWLADGGDGFGAVLGGVERRNLGDAVDVDVFLRSLRGAASPRGREGRVVVDGPPPRCDEATPPLGGASPAVAGFLGGLSMVSSFVATYPLSTLQTRAMLGEPLGFGDGCGLYRGVNVAACAVYASGTVFWAAQAFFAALLEARRAGRRGDVPGDGPRGPLQRRRHEPVLGRRDAAPGGAARDAGRRRARAAAGLVLRGARAESGAHPLPRAAPDGLRRAAARPRRHGASAGPSLIAAAAAAATLAAAVVTHPLQWYRSRLQATDVSHGHRPAKRGTVFDGLSIKLLHTVLSNTLMYISKEQLTEFVLGEFEKRVR